MRDWRSYWQERATSRDADLATELREVGKTVMGVPISEQQLDLIVASVCEALDITRDDTIADLGCGNGLITTRVSPHAARIVGFDISRPLIQAARDRHAGDVTKFEAADICALDFSSPQLCEVTKVYLYEVAQHLTTDEFARILENSFKRGSVTKLFSGSMPDAARLEKFYDTPARMALYRQNLAENREQIGHWWQLPEIEKLAADLELRVEVRQQCPELHTAHYRFDALFQR